MELEDRIAFVTPEGIELHVELAGLGSRFTALLVDLVVRALIMGALLVAAEVPGSLSDASTNVVIGVLAIAFFLIMFVYDVAFEVLAGGRTPGKRANGLRVIREGGQPVGLSQSLVRNAIRLLEGLPTLYIPASISVIVTKRNQRLGDLAAGTVVVRDEDEEARVAHKDERRRASGSATVAAPLRVTARIDWADGNAPPSAADMRDWDVSGLGQDEIAAVREFLARRQSLTAESRARLGGQLAAGVRAKVVGADPGLDAEVLLEAVSAAKAARG